MSVDDHPPPWREGDAGIIHRVFEQMPVAQVALDGPDRIFVAANAAYRWMVGREDLVGHSLQSVFPEAEGQQLLELYDRLYTTGVAEKAREWRIWFRRRAGGTPEEAYVDFTGTPRRGSDGGVLGVMFSVVDVTERVRLRQQAQRDGAAAQRDGGKAEGPYERASDVAALQEALLPTALPVLPRARIAARYLVAPAGQAAGGDWFDAMPLPGGSVGLVVGDVVGHGVGAAAAMGQLRAVLRHVLGRQPDPAAALAQLDAFAAADPALRAATVCVAVLDPATGSVRYCACGHPPPLVVSPDRATRYLPASGAGPLGTGAGIVGESAVLAAGEIILLYSDGLIRRPGRTAEQGMAELAAVAGDAATGRVLPAGPGATPAEQVCQLTVELLTRTGHADDVTTLAAQRLPAPPAPLDLELPAVPGTVISLRRELDGWLAEIGVAAEDRQVPELAVTEVVTNAIEHAYEPDHPGTVRLEAALGEDGFLLARISDRGRWRVPRPRGDRGQGLMLARQLAGELIVRLAPPDAGAQPGTRGTVVTLRHRLHRPAMLASHPIAVPAVVAESVPFSATTMNEEPTPCVRVRGPADIATAERLASRLLAACRGGVLPLTVDLTEVTVLASAGVRALYQVREQLRAHQQELTLIAPPGTPAAAVLALARLGHD
ncbi:MAG: rsbU [Actinomycetia bacterium]|nr:rsbU [Actinomycetes bacterium]